MKTETKSLLVEAAFERHPGAVPCRGESLFDDGNYTQHIGLGLMLWYNDELGSSHVVTEKMVKLKKVAL